MERRKFLGATGGSLATFGGLAALWHNGANATPSNENTTGNETVMDAMQHEIEGTFDLVHPDEIEGDGSPEITVDGQTIVVRGTIEYASSTCGTAKLAYVSFEETQNRVDFLITAADAPVESDSGSGSGNETNSSNVSSGERDMSECPDDVAEVGYHAEVVVDGEFNTVVVSEHHAFGTDSASVSSY